MGTAISCATVDLTIGPRVVRGSAGVLQFSFGL